MRIALPIFGVIFLIPTLALALVYFVLGLVFAIIFSIAECFIKDKQSHGRNNLNRFENVVNGFLDIIKSYIQTMFLYKR